MPISATPSFCAADLGFATANGSIPREPGIGKCKSKPELKEIRAMSTKAMAAAQWNLGSASMVEETVSATLSGNSNILPSAGEQLGSARYIRDEPH